MEPTTPCAIRDNARESGPAAGRRSRGWPRSRPCPRGRPASYQSVMGHYSLISRVRRWTPPSAQRGSSTSGCRAVPEGRGRSERDPDIEHRREGWPFLLCWHKPGLSAGLGKCLAGLKEAFGVRACNSPDPVGCDDSPPDDEGGDRDEQDRSGTPAGNLTTPASADGDCRQVQEDGDRGK